MLHHAHLNKAFDSHFREPRVSPAWGRRKWETLPRSQRGLGYRGQPNLRRLAVGEAAQQQRTTFRGKRSTSRKEREMWS